MMSDFSIKKKKDVNLGSIMIDFDAYNAFHSLPTNINKKYSVNEN